jgi:hypothetical protein
MNFNKFLDIKEKYGHLSSWAIWNTNYITPANKINDLSIFDNIDDLSFTDLKINTHFILVGLNISKQINKPFANFHSGKNDYKLRYALQNTIIWGSYMTDIIKDFEQKISGKVMKYLNHNPTFLQDNIDTFKNEINYIGANKPILIALGNDVYKLLMDNLSTEYTIYKVPHYSSFINQYQLKEAFEAIISKIIE